MLVSLTLVRLVVRLPGEPELSGHGRVLDGPDATTASTAAAAGEVSMPFSLVVTLKIKLLR